MNAAHLHLIVNHAPVFGLVAGILLLAWGTIRNSPDVRIAAYIAFVLSGLAAGIAFLSGLSAESVVEDLPGITEAAIERHEEAAIAALSLACLAGAGGILGALMERSKRAAQRTAIAGLFVISLAALAAVGYAANLGGMIHHTEITAHR